MSCTAILRLIMQLHNSEQENRAWIALNVLCLNRFEFVQTGIFEKVFQISWQSIQLFLIGPSGQHRHPQSHTAGLHYKNLWMKFNIITRKQNTLLIQKIQKKNKKQMKQNRYFPIKRNNNHRKINIVKHHDMSFFSLKPSNVQLFKENFSRLHFMLTDWIECFCQPHHSMLYQCSLLNHILWQVGLILFILQYSHFCKTGNACIWSL